LLGFRKSALGLQKNTTPSIFLAALAALAVSLAAPRARAFEREWHLGGGLGLAAANGYQLGPAANLYAAYGISDVFDVRLELAASRHTLLHVPDATAPDNAFIYGGKLALAYKLDVIQWIPYLALTAGYLRVTERVAPFTLGQPTVGLLAGLDYAVSRNFGLGVAGSYDYAFHPGAAYASGFLRAEYRFGF
jgi:hypothetical protein